MIEPVLSHKSHNISLISRLCQTRFRWHLDQRKFSPTMIVNFFYKSVFSSPWYILLGRLALVTQLINDDRWQFLQQPWRLALHIRSTFLGNQSQGKWKRAPPVRMSSIFRAYITDEDLATYNELTVLVNVFKWVAPKKSRWGSTGTLWLVWISCFVFYLCVNAPQLWQVTFD